MARPYLDYIANTQTILQQGTPTVDLAIFHGAVEGVKGGLSDQSLNEAGYTYGFVTDGLLARQDAVVTDGRIWQRGPGYKALILNNVQYISEATAQKVLELGTDGLPIIVVGTPPSTIPGLPSSGSLAQAETRIQARFDQILRLPTSVSVDNIAASPRALLSANIRYAKGSQLTRELRLRPPPLPTLIRAVPQLSTRNLKTAWSLCAAETAMQKL